MAKKELSPVQRQVARVGRRLFAQTVLDALLWCWTGALVLSAVWFVLQSLLLEESPTWLRWAVAGGSLAIGAVLAVVIAVVRAPTRVAAALALDEKFCLRERVTTSLTLAPQLFSSPAGQALLEDTNQRVKDLDVGSRFPVSLSWKAMLPVSAAVLAGLALLYEPPQSQATTKKNEESSKLIANAPDIEQKMKELKKKAEQRATGRTKSEEVDKLESELEKIANKPRETQEQLRERVKEMTALEDMMKQKEKELAEKTRSLKNQLQQMDKLMQKSYNDGPAKDLDKALSEGKFDQAKEEIERLIKKLSNNELNQKEKEQLQKQLEEIQKKLERAANLKDKEEQLKKANLDPETLKREMQRLEEEKKKLKDLQDIASKLGQCQKQLKEGDLEQAAESLKAAANKMGDMELDEQDLQDIRDQLKRLQDAKDSC
jgi:uncharacterized coiled-coil DUF342 family protein